MLEPIVSDIVSRLDRAARTLSGAVLPGLAAAALIFGPVALEAQDDGFAPASGSVSLTVRGGLGVPVGDSASFGGIAKTGGSAGAELALHLSENLAITAGSDVQFLEGATDAAGVKWSDLRMIHVTAGPEFQFFSPETRWVGTLGVGAGITRLDMSETLDDGSAAPEAIEHTGLTFRGAAKLGYRVAESATLFLEPGVYLVTTDRAVTSELVDDSGAIVDSFDVGWTIPLQVGVRFHFQ